MLDLTVPECSKELFGRMSVKIFGNFAKFLENEDGATAIEYSFIAAAMGLVLVPALGTTSSGIGAKYAVIADLFDF